MSHRHRMIPLHEIITASEALSLKSFVSKRLEGTSIHATAMEWFNLDVNSPIRERWKKLEILPEYGAYLLEYYLQLK